MGRSIPEPHPDVPRIGIVISTTRDARFGKTVAEWIFAMARTRSDLIFEIIDLVEYALPFFNEPRGPKYVKAGHPAALKWTEKLSMLEGFVFVTAEYNHSFPAVLKNALDFAYPEFVRKPAAYVGYGALGAARAVEQLRLVCIELQMAPLQTAVHVSGPDFAAGRQPGRNLREFVHLARAVDVMLEDLAWWANTLKAGRDGCAETQARPATGS